MDIVHCPKFLIKYPLAWGNLSILVEYHLLLTCIPDEYWCTRWLSLTLLIPPIKSRTSTGLSGWSIECVLTWMSGFIVWVCCLWLDLLHYQFLLLDILHFEQGCFSVNIWDHLLPNTLLDCVLLFLWCGAVWRLPSHTGPHTPSRAKWCPCWALDLS